jgi:hypothetical protein
VDFYRLVIRSIVPASIVPGDIVPCVIVPCIIVPCIIVPRIIIPCVVIPSLEVGRDLHIKTIHIEIPSLNFDKHIASTSAFSHST